MEVGLAKVFNFSDKNPYFLEIIEVYLSLGIGISHNLISTLKLFVF